MQYVRHSQDFTETSRSNRRPQAAEWKDLMTLGSPGHMPEAATSLAYPHGGVLQASVGCLGISDPRGTSLRTRLDLSAQVGLSLCSCVRPDRQEPL